MRSDLYKYVSKNNIMTYSYMKDYAQQEDPLDDGGKAVNMSPRRRELPGFLKSILRQK